MKKLAIILVSLITAFASAAPAQAFPSLNMATTVKNPDVIDVRHRRYHRYGRDDYRYGRRYDRRHYRGGYYRRYDDNYGGAIIGGLAAGVLLGGLLNAQPYYARPYYARPYYGRPYYGGRAYYGGNSHVRSCYARYRSYRASDNTYQPYYGPRRQCR